MSHPSRTILAIAIGAVMGALTRFYVTEAAKAMLGEALAYYGTFLVNSLGCFIIAWTITANEERQHWAPEVRLAVVTGFCGAFTTFSTYGLETALLLESNWLMGMTYAIGSATSGMIGVGLGVAVARWMVGDKS